MSSSSKPIVRPVVRLCETGLMLALATVLSVFKLFDLPYGGSITLASMLPIVLIAYRHGTRWGLLTAAVYGLLQALLGAENFGYVPGFAAFVCILLFDYLLAFLGTALGGAFRKVKDPALGLALGAATACALRYLCHVISGCTVWASTPFLTDGAAVSFSLLYNLSYMLPETIVTAAAGWWIGKQLDFRKAELGRAVREQTAASVPATVLTALGRLSVVGTVVYALVEVVIALMLVLSAADFNPAAFALTAVILPWTRMLVVIGIGAVLAAICLLTARYLRKKQPKSV
ncbi:MAG: energy-coupled thiamine transporter ThiT [Clostridia bacterium]|nr:energy-coupled thiamine transporter ThiT [Clostridia bacterium]